MLAAEPSAAVTSPGRKLASTIAYLARVLKTPTIGTWRSSPTKHARRAGRTRSIRRPCCSARIGLGVGSVQAGYPVLLDIATNWISRLIRAHHMAGSSRNSNADDDTSFWCSMNRLPGLRPRRGQAALAARRGPL